MTSQTTSNHLIVTIVLVITQPSYIAIMDKEKCFMCKKEYSSKSSLNRHKKSHDHRRFLCTKCNTYFGRPHDLKRNQIHEHGPQLRIHRSPSNIRGTSPGTNRTNSVQKQSNLVLDEQAYTEICQRRNTRPSLWVPPRAFQLPPPQEGKWSYRTDNIWINGSFSPNNKNNIFIVSSHIYFYTWK